QKPGDAVEERGLARPVRSDEADDVPLVDDEGHVLVGHEAAEAFGDGGELEEGRHGQAAHPSQRRHGSERRPGGRSAAMRMMMMPRPASGPVPSVVLMSCEMGMRMTAPSTGPHSRPMPPTTVAIMGSVLQLRSSACSGKTARAQKPYRTPPTA